MINALRSVFERLRKGKREYKRITDVPIVSKPRFFVVNLL